MQSYETTEHKIKREFEAYGPIKRVGRLVGFQGVYDSLLLSVRSNCFALVASAKAKRLPKVHMH